MWKLRMITLASLGVTHLRRLRIFNHFSQNRIKQTNFYFRHSIENVPSIKTRLIFPRGGETEIFYFSTVCFLSHHSRRRLAAAGN